MLPFSLDITPIQSPLSLEIAPIPPAIRIAVPPRHKSSSQTYPPPGLTILQCSEHHRAMQADRGLCLCIVCMPIHSVRANTVPSKTKHDEHGPLHTVRLRLPQRTHMEWVIPVRVRGEVGIPLRPLSELPEMAKAVSAVDGATTPLDACIPGPQYHVGLAPVFHTWAPPEASKVEMWFMEKQPRVGFTLRDLLFRLCQKQARWFSEYPVSDDFLRNAGTDPLWVLWRQDPRIGALHAVAIRCMHDLDRTASPIFLLELEVRLRLPTESSTR